MANPIKGIKSLSKVATTGKEKNGLENLPFEFFGKNLSDDSKRGLQVVDSLASNAMKGLYAYPEFGQRLYEWQSVDDPVLKDIPFRQWRSFDQDTKNEINRKRSEFWDDLDAFSEETGIARQNQDKRDFTNHGEVYKNFLQDVREAIANGTIPEKSGVWMEPAYSKEGDALGWDRVMWRPKGDGYGFMRSESKVDPYDEGIDLNRSLMRQRLTKAFTDMNGTYINARETPADRWYWKYGDDSNPERVDYNPDEDEFMRKGLMQGRFFRRR